MQISRLQDVEETIQIAVAGTLSDAMDAQRLLTPPAQIVVGKPAVTELVRLLGNAEYIGTVFAHKQKHQTSRYTPEPFTLQNQNAPITATINLAVSPATITFAGNPTSNINVHTLVGGLLQDALYQTKGTDDLTAIATGVKNAVNALGISGVSATSSGAITSISGSPTVICKIGSSGIAMGIEVNRVLHDVEVSIWCPDPTMRFQVIQPILENIGTTENPFLTFFDGTALRIQYAGRDEVDDENQSAYSLYAYHMIFEVEYGIIRIVPGYQVAVVENDVQQVVSSP